MFTGNSDTALLNGPFPASFLLIYIPFQEIITICTKNAYGAGIRTQDLQYVSLIP